MPDVLAAADTINLAVAPVVFLDTCVLLDIVRAPLRNFAGNVGAATEVLTGANRNPPTIYTVIACPTPTEWGAHIEEAVQDCENAVNSVGAVSASCAFVGLPALGPLPAGLATLPDRLKALSKNLLDASILLDKDAEALSRAIDRIINARRPTRKGGAKEPKTRLFWNTPLASSTHCSWAVSPAVASSSAQPRAISRRQKPQTFTRILNRCLTRQEKFNTSSACRLRSRGSKPTGGCRDTTKVFARGYGFLVDQLNRVALSLATDLAEGNERLIKPDRRSFFKIARGRLGLFRAIFGDLAEELRELCRF
jgi:hypothetical protein